MAFVKGLSGNPRGRPVTKDAEKPTNRILRNKSLLEMVRKFKPIQAKAIAAAVKILDDKDASESGKLRSAALLIQTYKELVKDLYDYRYDDEEAEEIQKTDNKPVFSLKIINNEE